MSFEECPNCGTGQLQHEQYWGCLCSIICAVELTTEERIIKLLEEHRDSGARWHVAYASALTDAIALIKGENK